MYYYAFQLHHYPYWINYIKLTENDWSKIYTALSTFLAASQLLVCLSTHASANQTHFTNRASWSDREGDAAALWCWCAPAASAQGCMLRMSPHLCTSTITLWCRLTYLCLLLCNLELFCCSLIGSIIGTLSYGHRLYVQNWSLLKKKNFLKIKPTFCPLFSSNNVSQWLCFLK